ncbi:hypothetical protein ACFQY4_41690 [Catellatospora bangladeshensis]|uniref:Uncharacterized protein n=1 Tax=Catellatospora bangladeshensis TaxID=310355 RepID=A0A8J3NHI9_9ACTN|nr:hypothetical protein [Catellatospora bangladeshensis]GIF79843.1 hypothetical protein Cba03nite_11920 [Catellatospora bangladeshensis]
MSAETTATRPPATLYGAVALVVLQAVAVTVLAAALVYADFTASATDLRLAAGVTVFALAIAAWLGAVAWGLLRRRPGVRGPGLALELMITAPAFFMINGGMPAAGWAVMGSALAVIGLVLAPATTRWLGWRERA